VLTVLALAMLAGGPHPTSELLGHWRGDASLDGRLLDLKAGRVARHIRVSREASPR
jgi:hypothetical protein